MISIVPTKTLLFSTKMLVFRLVYNPHIRQKSSLNLYNKVIKLKEAYFYVKKNSIQYRQVCDYKIPNLVLPPEETKTRLGKWECCTKIIFSNTRK